MSSVLHLFQTEMSLLRWPPDTGLGWGERQGLLAPSKTADQLFICIFWGSIFSIWQVLPRILLSINYRWACSALIPPWGSLNLSSADGVWKAPRLAVTSCWAQDPHGTPQTNTSLRRTHWWCKKKEPGSVFTELTSFPSKAQAGCCPSLPAHGTDRAQDIHSNFLTLLQCRGDKHTLAWVCTRVPALKFPLTCQVWPGVTALAQEGLCPALQVETTQPGPTQGLPQGRAESLPEHACNVI